MAKNKENKPMSTFQIWSDDAGDMGCYEAADAQGALDAMASDAGYEDDADYRHQLGCGPDAPVSRGHGKWKVYNLSIRQIA